MSQQAVYTYSPEEYRISIGGQLAHGFEDGTFVEVAPDEDLYNKHTGADGRTSRARTANRSGTITLTLARTSPFNAVMSAFMLADEAADAGVFPVLIKDGKGSTRVFSATSWIQTRPTMADSKDIEPRQWVIACSRIDLFVGGNNARVG